MTTWIALFRGINVGGKNVLPMKDLTRDLSELGLGDVQTYIQSGNVVFRSAAEDAARLGDDISALVERHHGFAPRVLILSVEQLGAAIESNPFREAENEPKTLHFFFLGATPPAPDLEALADIQTGSERFHLSADVFYLHAPDGIGRSKLAAAVEKHLGVPATARNWRTVARLWEMAQG